MSVESEVNNSRDLTRACLLFGSFSESETKNEHFKYRIFNAKYEKVLQNCNWVVSKIKLFSYYRHESENKTENVKKKQKHLYLLFKYRLNPENKTEK